MEVFIVSSWKPLALRGLAGLLFGVLAFTWPAITLVALVLVFGGYALLYGLFALAAATRQNAREHAWTLAVEGLLGVGVGLAALLWTGMTALGLVDLIAFWSILTGLLELMLAVRLRRVIPGELLLAFSGAASILLGVVIVTRPVASAFVIVVLLGGYAFCFGAAMFILALRLRRRKPRFASPDLIVRSRHGALRIYARAPPPRHRTCRILASEVFMATKAQQHQSEEERAHRAGLPKSHVSTRKPKKATWGRDKAHAGAKATHALEDSAPGQRPSRESTRGSANRAKPDSALNRTEQATKGSPTNRARMSHAKGTKVRRKA